MGFMRCEMVLPSSTQHRQRHVEKEHGGDQLPEHRAPEEGRAVVRAWNRETSLQMALLEVLLVACVCARREALAPRHAKQSQHHDTCTHRIVAGDCWKLKPHLKSNSSIAAGAAPLVRPPDFAACAGAFLIAPRRRHSRPPRWNPWRPWAATSSAFARVKAIRGGRLGYKLLFFLCGRVDVNGSKSGKW